MDEQKELVQNAEDTEESSAPEESQGAQESQSPSEAEILARVLEKLDLLTQSGEEGEAQELKKSPAPPPPPQLPERPSRITQAAYEELARYAAKQAQEAYRYKLAAEYDLDPEELGGEFESPQDMRRFAEMAALRKRLADLEGKLAAAQSPKSEETPASPPGDTGGPTGRKDAREYLEKKYQEIRQMGHGDEALRRYLTMVYQDPDRIIR